MPGIFTLIGSALTILFASFTYAQVTYQGPATGNVVSGVILNTDNFNMPLSDISEQDNVYNKNIEVDLLEPPDLFLSSNQIFESLYVEDPSVMKSINGIGDNTMLIQKFPGIPQTNSIPPDPIVAVGPNHILACVNSRFSIWDKNGNLLKSISANTWCSNVLANPGPFDPQIIYDHYAGRWFMLWDNQNDATQTGNFIIFYSDDDNPLGTWYGYALDATKNGTVNSNSWGDYPQIGFDDKAIYINSRQFNFDGVRQYDKIRILNKAELYASNGGTLNWRDLWDISLPGSTVKPDVIHPSYHYSNANEHYFLNGGNFTSNSFYTLYKLSDPLGAATLSGVNISVANYQPTPLARQLGGGTILIETGSSKFSHAPIFRNGFLYAVHSMANPSDPANSSIRYIKIDLSNNTISESVTLGAINFWYYYPTLAVDKDGNVVITCSRSGLTEYIGSYYITRRATDPPGLSGAKVLSEGKGNYVKDFNSGRNRWGDYNGIYLDPSDEYSFWLFPEHAEATNTWGTTIGQVRLEPFPGIFPFVDQSVYEFPDTEVGFQSSEIKVVVANYGQDDLVINSIPQSQGDFILTSTHSFPLTLSTFDSLVLSFTFNPTTDQEQNIIYSVNSNSIDFNGFNFLAKGFIIKPAVGKQIYAISGAQNSGSTAIIDKVTSTGTNIGFSNFTDIIGLAIHPVTNLIYGIRSNTTDSEILRINSQFGDAYTLFSLPIPNLLSITFDNNGELFGSFKNGEIHKINLETGTSNLIVTSESGSAGPLAITFHPLTNELWASYGKSIGTPKDLIVKINLTTGDTTKIGQTGFAVLTTDIEFDEIGNLYGVKGINTTVSDLLNINTTTGVGAIIGSIGLKDIKAIGYSSTILTSVDDQNVVSIPKDFVLDQNYPNPFNPSTQIRFALPVNSFVKISVFNILGEVVKEILSNDLSAGLHTVVWNGDDKSDNKVSSGIYFYELKATGVDGNQFNQIRKMILLK